MKKTKTMFIGTSNFAVPVLKALLELNFLNIVCVVTQPDRPVGRKQVLTPPPVKQLLLENTQFDVSVEQPPKIRKVGKELLGKYSPELILVASYGQIIPKNMLTYPKYKCLNLHVSLLPHLRGAVPMPMAILEGLSETGTTLQIMEERLDEGDIIAMRKISIDKEETAQSLELKSAEASIELLKEELPRWIAGEVTPIPQDESKATYCYISDLKKDNAEINFETDIEQAERMVRAFYPWPIAWVEIPNGTYKGKRLKIFSLNGYREGKHGVFSIEKKGDSLVLNVSNGELVLNEIQLEGKKKENASNYLYLVD